MADNYLEKKMDDYRRGKSMSAARCRAASVLRPGQVVVSFPRCAVMVIAGCVSPGVSETVRLLRKFGCKVNLCSTSAPLAMRELAWETGCTFNPEAFEVSLRQAVNQRGELDALVVFDEAVGEFTGAEGVERIIYVGAKCHPGCRSIVDVDDPVAVASAVLLLTRCGGDGGVVCVAGARKNP